MMRLHLLATFAILLATPAAAQDHDAHAGHAKPATPQAQRDPAQDALASDDKAEHRAMDHGPMDHETIAQSAKEHETEAQSPAASGPPPHAFEGPEHAADTIYGVEAMAPSRQAVARENGQFSGGTFMVERLEARIGKEQDFYLWDTQGWYGGDIDKLWFKSEGEGAFRGDVETAEVQALWGHAIGPWFDLQVGARYDFEPDGRAHAVLGLQGLAPYMFEIDAAAFLSDKGDLTARIEAEYDQRITQRLILQPRLELNLSAQDTIERSIGSGLSSIETGLRLRYEIIRELAPYIGVGYEAKLGDTADIARADGEDTNRVSLLFGVRAWF